MSIDQNQHLKSIAVETGEIDGYEYWITPAPSYIAGLNGYLKFGKRLVRERGYDGILVYVPVHGGITYANEDKDGIVYGFDTGHCDSDEYPINDKGWIKSQIEIMLKGILKAKEVEKNYLRCITSKGKSKYAQAVFDVAPESESNFGINMNLLSGHL